MLTLISCASKYEKSDTFIECSYISTFNGHIDADVVLRHVLSVHINTLLKVCFVLLDKLTIDSSVDNFATTVVDVS